MTNVTIEEITRELTTVDGAAYMEGQDGGGSFKAQVTAINNAKVTQALTLDSGSPTDCDPTADIIVLTTDGSGGNQVVNLPLLAVDGNGINAEAVGRTIVFSLPALADPADTVTITFNSSMDIPGINFDVAGNFQSRIVGSSYVSNTGILLNFAGAITAIIWGADGWYWNRPITDYDDGQDTTNVLPLIRGVPLADPGSPDNIWSDGGNLKLSGTTPGVSGSFLTADAKTVTVTNGVITAIA